MHFLVIGGGDLGYRFSYMKTTPFIAKVAFVSEICWELQQNLTIKLNSPLSELDIEVFAVKEHMYIIRMCGPAVTCVPQQDHT